MKNYLIGFVWILISITGAQGQDTTWKEYIHNEDLMAFSLPSEPKYSAQTVDTAVGPVTLHIYILELNNANQALGVTVNVFPDSVLKTPAAKTLEGTRNGVLAQFTAKESSEKQITLDGHPGLEFQFAGTTVHGSYRVYLVGTRLYQLASLSMSDPSALPETDRFFNSFRLVKP